MNQLVYFYPRSGVELRILIALFVFKSCSSFSCLLAPILHSLLTNFNNPFHSRFAFIYFIFSRGGSGNPDLCSVVLTLLRDPTPNTASVFPISPSLLAGITVSCEEVLLAGLQDQHEIL